MKNILEQIFIDVISRADDCLEADSRIDDKVHEVLAKYQLSDEDSEIFAGELYYISTIAQKEGFVLGLKYVFKIVIELLS